MMKEDLSRLYDILHCSYVLIQSHIHRPKAVRIASKFNGPAIDTKDLL